MKKRYTEAQIIGYLKEAKIMIENWRIHYNTIRPHSSLNYRPPAPQTLKTTSLPSRFVMLTMEAVQ